MADRRSSRTEQTAVAVGPRRCVADQFLAKADVTQCTNVFGSATRKPSSPSLVKVWERAFRVDGQTILEEENAARTFDEVELVSLERLFPGFTEDNEKQAKPSAGQSGFER